MRAEEHTRTEERATGRRAVLVQVQATDEAASRAGAAWFVDQAERAIEARGRFSVAQSGGDTPRRTYAMLADEPFASRVAWDGVHVFWDDVVWMLTEDVARGLARRTGVARSTR